MIEHRIEESVRVYLVLGEDGSDWEIDGVTVDGHPLFSDYERGPGHEACAGCPDRVAGDELAVQASAIELPTGEQLMHLLADSLGYRCVKEDS